MIVLKRKFRTVVKNSGDVLLRVCTGKTVTSLHEDDIMDKEPCAPDEIFVRSVRDVKPWIRKQMWLTALLSVLSFSGLCFAVWNFVIEQLTTLDGKLDLTFSLAVVMGVIFCIQFKQLLFPVVYDCDGKWVEIRTGKSSLCGGIRIKKKG